MSARKLGRLAGFVFVLAVAFGGAGVSTLGAAPIASGGETSVQASTLEFIWD